MEYSISFFSVDYAVLIIFRTSSVVLFDPVPYLFFLNMNYGATWAVPSISDVRRFSVGVTTRVSVLKAVDK